MVFACDFISTTPFAIMNQIFANFSLPWTAQAVETAFFRFNDPYRTCSPNLPLSFRAKTVLLSKVQRQDILYFKSDLPPGYAVDLSESADGQSLVSVASGKSLASSCDSFYLHAKLGLLAGAVGDGQVAFVGTQGSPKLQTSLVLAACGIVGSMD